MADYFEKHPDESMAGVDKEEMVFRYRVVETFLAAGVELAKTYISPTTAAHRVLTYLLDSLEALHPKYRECRDGSVA